MEKKTFILFCEFPMNFYFFHYFFQVYHENYFFSMSNDPNKISLIIQFQLNLRITWNKFSQIKQKGKIENGKWKMEKFGS